MTLAKLLYCSAFALLVAATSAVAQDYTETGDAGATIAGAQATGGTAGVDLFSITGTVDAADLVDVFSITIATPGTFSATTVNGVTNESFDTQLWLFDSTGAPVYANDDDPSGTSFFSTLPAGDTFSPTTPGTYYIVVGFSGAVATNGAPNNQDLFAAFVSSTEVRGPNGDASPQTLVSFDNTNAATAGVDFPAQYRIDFAAVPEPSSLALVGIGAFGLAGSWLRRRRR